MKVGIKMKQWLKYALGVISCSMLAAAMVFAADSQVAETYTGEDTISVYIRGIDSAGKPEVQIGTSAADVKSTENLGESSVPIKTLIMIDNSISIKKQQQERIMELVQDLVAGRMEHEQIALATFGEEINYITQYSEDYGELKQGLTGITYENQETYLTDILYDVLMKRIEEDSEENFYRVVIISDGVDNKSVGVTKEELYQHLKENVIPIYAIGCKEKGNDEELENMFALSRITGTQFFLLDDVENTLEIVNTLTEDQNIVRVQISPAAVSMDGSHKAVKITQGTESIQLEMRMPQQEMVEETEAKPEPVPESVPAPKSAQPAEKEEPAGTPYAAIWIVAGLAAAALIIIVVTLILLLKRKKPGKPNGFEPFTGSVGKKDNGGGKTVLIGGSKRKYDLILEDITNPARLWQTSISENAPVIIGRKEDSDYCIDYDKSVSGRHCEIRVQNDRFYVRDLQSSNGTFLNDNRVITESELIAGNILRLGAVRLRVGIR